MRIQEHWQNMEGGLEAWLLTFFTLLGAAETPEDWPYAGSLPAASTDQRDTDSLLKNAHPGLFPPATPAHVRSRPARNQSFKRD
ncbi:MAG: hypothetical protein Q8J78_04465 [Moraxellaceae bacterium]|nr:hypothetical protein [Moraxellaceae bacterium]